MIFTAYTVYIYYASIKINAMWNTYVLCFNIYWYFREIDLSIAAIVYSYSNSQIQKRFFVIHRNEIDR